MGDPISITMAAAPLVMGAGSMLTKDKTLKGLLQIGSLATGAANLGMGLMGGPEGIGNLFGGGGSPATAGTSMMASGGPVSVPAAFGSAADYLKSGGILPGLAPGAAAAGVSTAGVKAAGGGLRFNDVMNMSMLTGMAGNALRPGQTQVPGAPMPPVMPPPQPSPLIPSQFTPSAANSPATNAAYQRFLQMMQSQGR